VKIGESNYIVGSCVKVMRILDYKIICNGSLTFLSFILGVVESGSIYGICTGYVRDIYGTAMGEETMDAGRCLQEDGRCHNISMDQERFYYGSDREDLWL
jgi:hypothetical protein